MITWRCIPFSELDVHSLYQLLKLRVNVFVVEQTCPYPELDDKDTHIGTYHLMGFHHEQLVACARLLPAGISYPSVSIGRIATAMSVRGKGIGHQLLTKALTECQVLWPNQSIEIGAQQHLNSFYQHYGFVCTSESYLEDNILHVDMKRDPMPSMDN